MLLCLFFGFWGILWTEKSGVIAKQGVFFVIIVQFFLGNNFGNFPCFLALSKEKPRMIAGSNAVPVACDAHTLRSRLSVLTNQMCYRVFDLLHFIINYLVKKAHKGHKVSHSLCLWNIIAQLIIFATFISKMSDSFASLMKYTFLAFDYLFHALWKIGKHALLTNYIN